MLADINRFRKGIQRDGRRKILIQIFLDFLTLLAEGRLVLRIDPDQAHHQNQQRRHQPLGNLLIKFDLAGGLLQKLP